MWRKLPGPSICQIPREGVERSVCTCEMSNSKAGTSLFATNSKEFENAIAAFEGSVYPQADPDAVTITPKDLKILKPCEFLSDAFIDFYIKLQQYNECKGLCIPSSGPDQPAEVVSGAPDHMHPGACLFSTQVSQLSCNGYHPFTRRL